MSQPSDRLQIPWMPYRKSGLHSSGDSLTCSETRAVSLTAKQSQTRSQVLGPELDSSGAKVVDEDGDGVKSVTGMTESLHMMSSSRARVVACRRMKFCTPTDGSKTSLSRESEQRRGKCSPSKDSPAKVPTCAFLCRVSSVRGCCIGISMRGQRVPQKWDQRSSIVNGTGGSKSGDSRKRRSVVKTVWNVGDSRGERSEVRRLYKESNVRSGARTRKLEVRALRTANWSAWLLLSGRFFSISLGCISFV
ncbi:hypothetical protein EDB86DRAFT_2913743, partial [Lactarius hatsudake]